MLPVVKGIFSFLVLFAVVMISCNKEEDYGEKLPLIFESLTADHDTIGLGGVTKITAIATGNKLKYHWSVSAGTLLGSGFQVTYTTDPCVPGDQYIHCTVKDIHGDEETKTVKVFVRFN